MEIKKSTKTTIMGILTGVGLLITQAQAILDDDPETVPEWPVLVAAIGAMGLGTFSRDDDVTSEGRKIRR